MVSDPRATAGADRLRPLNRPRPVTVLTQDRPGAEPAADPGDPESARSGDVARPLVLIASGRRRRIANVRDTWRIDEEWWRDAISRRYYQLELDDGSLRTVYQDLVDGRWYAQEY